MSDPGWLGTAYAHPDEVSDSHWDRTMMTREQYAAMVTERSERDQMAPKVGERAPDFTAHRLSGSGRLTGETFRLGQALGRPIGLIFGSYT